MKYPLILRQTKPNNELIFIDIWYPNFTAGIGHNKEHFFEEMDKNNDKMITPNEFDRDLK